MKNKTALYISIAALVLVIAGGFFVIKNVMKPVVQTPEDEEQISDLPPVDASVVVTVTGASSGKEAILAISQIPEGTTSIEYEFSYLNSEGLSRGALGKIDVNGKGEIEKSILLGTCSKNTCTYDTGVTSVDLVLKFNHPDGASQFSKTFEL